MKSIGEMEIRNCSYSSFCNQNFMCKSTFNSTGMMENCSVSCCDKDLCNTGNMSTSQPPTEPAGTDLTCYACSDAPDSTGPTCKSGKTKQVRCSVDPLTGRKQDKCMTTWVSLTPPGSNKVLDFKINNCSDSLYCNHYCQLANMTGGLQTCRTRCCQGNLCNVEGPNPTSSGISLNVFVAHDRQMGFFYNLYCKLGMFVLLIVLNKLM